MMFKDSIHKFLGYLEDNDYSDQTICGYKKELSYLNHCLEDKYNGPIYLDEITKEDIKEYLSSMKARGCVAVTRNRAIFVFRSYYNYLTREGLVDVNPALNVKPTRTRLKERVYLTKSEVETLTGAIRHPVIRAAVWTAYYTGLRPSELLALLLKDIDLVNGIVHVRQGKGNKDRDIPISSELNEILYNYLNGDRPQVASAKVFATAQSGSLTLQYFNRRIEEAAASLGWQKEVSAHILRHSFASRLVSMDVNIAKIQRLLGHSSINVTAIYAHSNMDDLVDAVKKL